jgi:hypothetical protein
VYAFNLPRLLLLLEAALLSLFLDLEVIVDFRSQASSSQEPGSLDSRRCVSACLERLRLCPDSWTDEELPTLELLKRKELLLAEEGRLLKLAFTLESNPRLRGGATSGTSMKLSVGEGVRAAVGQVLVSSIVDDVDDDVDGLVGSRER